MTFVNLFKISEPPKKLYRTRVIPAYPGMTFSDEQKALIFKHTGNLAREMSTSQNVVSSNGGFLVSEAPIDNIPVKPDLFYGGIEIKGVSTNIIGGEEIRLDADHLPDYRNFLNRKCGHLLVDAGYIQDARFFWKPNKQRKEGNFIIRKGILTYTRPFPGSDIFLLVDYATAWLSSQTIWETISQVLERNGVDSWHDADPTLFGFLRGKSAKASYSIWGMDGWEQQSIRIQSVDLATSTSDAIPELGGSSVVDYHRKFGRKVEPVDQPVIRYRVGNRILTQAPSLLFESPNPASLKHYSEAVSRTAFKIARRDPLSRFCDIKDYLSDLLDSKFISLPENLPADQMSPQITMGEDFIEINSDQDFSKYYSKGSLARKPDWNEIHFFYDQRQEFDAQEFAKGVLKVLKHFKIGPTWVNNPFITDVKLGGEAFFRNLREFIFENGRKLTSQDLVLWYAPTHDEACYNSLKKELTIFRDIPTQQTLAEVVRNAITQENLIGGYINPLSSQLVAKAGGCPYLFQAGITSSNTIFIGLDRYRDSFKEKASVTAAAASFSDHGEYLGACSSVFDASPTDDIRDIRPILSDLLSNLQNRDGKFTRAIILRDGRIQNMGEEIDASMGVLTEFGLQGAFVTSNKSSHLRIFEGNPETEDIEGKPDQYLGITRYYDPQSFVVVSTQPIISRNMYLGTPRPILYTVEKSSLPESMELLKADLARGLIAFTRMNWASFKGNRQPAPLTFAHKLASLCSTLGVSWSPKLRRPTYL